MFEQRKPLTYESVLEMFRRAGWRMKKFERQMKERAKEAGQQMRETDKKISALGSRIGDIVENMVSGNGNVIDKSYTLGYTMTEWNPRKKFWDPSTGKRGEVDVFLENKDIAVLIEVKTSLETADVREHMERLTKFRRCADAKGDKRHFLGAVAGAAVGDEAKDFAHENGMFVVQSGEAVEIVPPPEGFKAKEW